MQVLTGQILHESSIVLNENPISASQWQVTGTMAGVQHRFQYYLLPYKILCNYSKEKQKYDL